MRALPSCWIFVIALASSANAWADTTRPQLAITPGVPDQTSPENETLGAGRAAKQNGFKVDLTAFVSKGFGSMGEDTTDEAKLETIGGDLHLRMGGFLNFGQPRILLANEFGFGGRRADVSVPADRLRPVWYSPEMGKGAVIGWVLRPCLSIYPRSDFGLFADLAAGVGGMSLSRGDLYLAGYSVGLGYDFFPNHAQFPQALAVVARYSVLGGIENPILDEWPMEVELREVQLGLRLLPF